MNIEERTSAYNDAVQRMNDAAKAIEDAAADADLDALASAFDTANAEVERSKAELETLKRIQEARNSNPVIVAPTSNTESQGEVRVYATPKGLKTEQTYRPDNGTSFFRDLYLSGRGDTAARERMGRHDAETRDLTTTATDGGGFVPPLYVGQELWAHAPRQGRPFADAIPTRPLQAKGMSITLPRVTTAPATAFQTTENVAMNETELVEATVTIPVCTLGGIEDVSLQLLERSDPPIDDVIWLSLRESYDTELDAALIHGSGSGATHCGVENVSGVNTTTYTDASPTAAETVPPIFEAISEVYSNRFRPADLILMHPRRAAWLSGTLSSSQSLFQYGSLFHGVGTQDMGFANNFAGLRVVIDANVTTTNGSSTNEDQIIICHSPDLVLWEGGLRAEVFRETLSAEGTVRLRLYAYSAFASERYPSGISVISGTGLVTPTFA